MDRPIGVLVVDDHESSRKSLRALLHLWGHEARVARDTQEALGQAATLLPDLALIRVAPPALKGVEVARRLWTIPGLEGLVLVAVVGQGQEAAGFDNCLVEPFEPAELERLLEVYCPRA